MSLADLTRLIEGPDTPVEKLARALLFRSYHWGTNGEPQKALADYSRVIEMKDAPAELMAKAFGNRAWEQYLKRDFPAFFPTQKMR